MPTPNDHSTSQVNKILKQITEVLYISTKYSQPLILINSNVFHPILGIRQRAPNSRPRKAPKAPGNPTWQSEKTHTGQDKVRY